MGSEKMDKYANSFRGNAHGRPVVWVLMFYKTPVLNAHADIFMIPLMEILRLVLLQELHLQICRKTGFAQYVVWEKASFINTEFAA